MREGGEASGRVGRLALAALVGLGALQAGCDRGVETGPDTSPTAAATEDGSDSSAGEASPPASEGPALVDVTAATGLDFVQRTGQGEVRRLLTITGTGAGLVDLDGDGDLDVLLLQGRPLAEGLGAPPGGWRDRFFRNLLVETGELRFEDHTEEIGLATGEELYPLGLAAGYADEDSRWDLLVTGFGDDRLFLGREGGLESAAFPDDGSLSTGASFVDLDRDGDQDLYVSRYAVYGLDRDQGCRGPTGFADYCGPSTFPGLADRVLLNDGGRFRDASSEWGVQSPALHGLGTAVVDVDEDSWPDVFVANDGDPNLLWRNLEGRGFEDLALMAGTAVNNRGQAEAGMGIVAGDLDGDGHEDLFLTHLGRETNTFYRRTGKGGSFTDASAQGGLGAPSLPYTGFGTAGFDLENDGDIDVFVSNGAVRVIEAQRKAGDPFPLREPAQVYRNEGGGRFVAAELPESLVEPRVGRGVAVGDVDGDGDADLLTIALEGPVLLLRNDEGPGRWLGLDLRLGDGRSALGAEGRLVLDDGSVLLRRVRVDAGFLSIQDPRLIFGLGDRNPVSLSIRWPDGTEEEQPTPDLGGYSTRTPS